MGSGNAETPREKNGVYEHELAFTKRLVKKAEYRNDPNEREDTIPADVERVVNAASTSTLVPTPPQREEGSERVNNLFSLARQGTIAADLKPSVHDASTSTLAPTPPQPPATSQCYSELEDISDQIRCLGSDELRLIEAFSRADSVPPDITHSTSLGKRGASDALGHLEPPAFKRPRTTMPLAEEPQPLFPDAETSSATNPSSARDIPFIIAHSDHLQKCFDSRKLSCGVQWEIARLVTTRREDPADFSFIPIDCLDSLKGSNTESAEKTAKLILDIDTGDNRATRDANARERSAKAPWKELDTEEAAHLQNPEGGGLGFNPDFPGWHGGKVHFCARLKNIGTAKMPQYKFILERAVLGPSCLFTRRFMSERFLTIKVPKQILNNPNNGLLELFLRPFVLTGRVFRAFYAKDENVFMIETDEIADGGTISASRRPASPMGPCSLQAFLSWHNPLELNTNQVITKWASRFALGLSNSVPGLCLDLGDIIPEVEIISSEGSEMTDGCGYINRAALQRLRKKFEWHEFPTAIQFRLAGCKGLLMLHPDDTENESDIPRVWIRPSQRKIKYNKLDSAQLTIDVLRKSYMKTPTRLSTEVIINLAENGVPHKNIVKLFRDSLEEHIAGLTKWDGPNAMFDLYCQVARVGGVISARLAREAGGEARVRGYGLRENESSDPDDEDEFAQPDPTLQRSTPWSPDLISGCPSSLEETAMVLLDSGFTPQNCAVLRDKLKMVAETSTKNFMAKYRIDVQMSCSAFVVPDPFGVLKDNEIQCKSSHQNLRTANGLETDTVLGDVLITRNPCKLPTDMRKVKAVEKPELRHLTDVIVCSIQGYRRFLDFLAGGDYDGDIATVLYDPRLVDHFKNADLKYSYEPIDLANDFSRINETVSEWLERTSSLSQTARMHELQIYLLGQIRDTSIVGIYSGFHDVSTYKYGYADERTWRLVYMFCSVLDAIKTGRIVLPSTLIEDRRKFGSRVPAWKETDDAKEKASLVPTAGDHPKREGHVKHKRFIMDVIDAAVKEFGQAKRIQLDSLFASSDYPVVDPDLTAPWFTAENLAAQFKQDKDIDHPLFKLQRQLIQDHVHTVAKRYKESVRSNFSSLRIETRQDILRDLAMEFASGPLPSEVYMEEDEIARLRASYAYYYDSEEYKYSSKWTRFPWNMAMRELCAIKARALGPFKVVTVDYYERFVFKQSSSKRS